MIKIRKFKKAKNNFPLKERSVASIKMFDTQKEFYPGDDPDEILEHFELLYELEYKYHAIRNNNFLGMERRRDNILDIIEEKSKIVIEALAGTFEIVFADWLDKHAITDPQKWAEQRFYENGDSMVEMEGFEPTVDILLSELKRYRRDIQDIGDIVNELLKMGYEIIDEDFLNDVVSDRYDMIIDDLEDVEIDEFNEMYSSLFNIEFETEEEARDWLDKNFSAFDKDLFKIFGGREEAYEYYIDWLIQIQTEFFTNTEYVERALDIDEFFITTYREIVFPAWYDYWSSMGIDETRENVEDVYEQLTSIEKQPLRKQFMILNIAKNTNHQNGSMMEYYEEMWGTDYDQLMKLSEMDVSEWNEELEEIGVDL